MFMQLLLIDWSLCVEFVEFFYPNVTSRDNLKTVLSVHQLKNSAACYNEWSSSSLWAALKDIQSR